MKRHPHLRNKGSVALLAFIGVVPLVAAIGGLSVDCMHVNDARGELQRATDAAALAGAEDLNNYLGSLATSASTTSNANEEPVNFALEVAAMNAVDGVTGVYQSTPLKRTITASIVYDPNFSGTSPTPNRCNVQANVYINSLFAKLFGNYGQTVSTYSSAAAGGQNINTITGYGPLLIGYPDQVNGVSLENLTPGGTLTVQWHAGNGPDAGNAEWTTTPNGDAEAEIAYLADPADNPNPNLPPIYIGETIDSSNGGKAPDANFAGLVGKTITFAVTTQHVDTGPPKWVISYFIALKITGADGSNPAKWLQGTVVSAIGAGTNNTGIAGNPGTNGSNVKTVHLVQ